MPRCPKAPCRGTSPSWKACCTRRSAGEAAEQAHGLAGLGGFPGQGGLQGLAGMQAEGGVGLEGGEVGEHLPPVGEERHAPLEVLLGARAALVHQCAQVLEDRAGEGGGFRDVGVDAGIGFHGHARRLPAGRRRKTEIQVIIDLPTLLGLREDPAHLPGHGPLPAVVARELAADADWRRLVVDPVDGHLLDYGHRAYRPPKKLRDYISARDRTCRFPGCGQPAARCDLDHVAAWKPGRTAASNIIPLCRHHHRLKTHHRWQVTLNEDSSVDWQSPAGREYHLKPRNQLDN